MVVAAAEAAGAATLPALGAAAITTLGAAAAGRGVAEQSHRERLKQLRTEVTALQELQQQVRQGLGAFGETWCSCTSCRHSRWQLASVCAVCVQALLRLLPGL